MYGYELQKARDSRRRELRRELRERIGPDRALDSEDLLDRLCDPYPSTWGAVLRERCVFKQLQAIGIGDARVAKAFGLCEEELRRRRDRSWFAPSNLAADIEHRVAEEIYETPEPDRYVAALDGKGGPVNPLPPDTVPPRPAPNELPEPRARSL